MTPNQSDGTTSHEVTVACNKAGCFKTTVVSHPSSQSWLIGEHDGDLYVRCPLHITDWAMRKAGKRRTKATYRWRREGLTESVYNDLHSPVIEPFWTGDLSEFEFNDDWLMDDDNSMGLPD